MNITALSYNMFHGRLGRLGFILGLLYYFVATFVPLLLATFVLAVPLGFMSHPSSTIYIVPVVVLAAAWYAVVIICLASLLVRRLHDMNRTGVMAWLYFVPFINLALLIYVLVAPGSPSANDYGVPPASNNFYFVTGLRK